LILLTLLAAAAPAAPSAEVVLKGFEKTSWPAFYERAGELLQDGQVERAGIFFYAGQFRARASMLCNKQAPDGGPALLGSLNEVIGGPVNKAVGQSVTRWVRVIDATLIWTDRHGDPETPRPRCAAAIRDVRTGLIKLRATIAGDPEAIRSTRTANGLPNDPD